VGRRTIRPLVIGVLFALGAMSAVAVPYASAAGQTVYTWGAVSKDDSPTAVGGIPGTIKQLVTTNSDTYALTSSGQVYAFGSDRSGELGDGTTQSGWQESPVRVRFPAGVEIARLASVGPEGTEMAIDTTGHVWGWGKDSYGQLCLGAAKEERSPVELPLSNVSLATGAGDHAAYDSAGVLEECGQNHFGDLGDGALTPSFVPTKVTGLPAGAIVSLTAAWSNVGAVMADGSYYDWGYNAAGQLGDGSTTSSDVPVKVPFYAPVAIAAEGGGAANDGQSVVILRNGTIWGWGDDHYGQLCTGTTSDQREQPLQISPPSKVKFVNVATGGATDYFLDSSGNVWSCGDNANGQLGRGTKRGDSATPRKVLAGADHISSTNFNVAALS
jgi:alpha-tubulin suppressor-like RCC1 family protein